MLNSAVDQMVFLTLQMKVGSYLEANDWSEINDSTKMECLHCSSQ